MRDQYAGDISDLLKFAFLRALAGGDRAIGVGWYLNLQHDGGSDGRHCEYRTETKWENLDSTLFQSLSDLPERSVRALEELPIWPLKTKFHRVPVPTRRNRQSWAVEMKRALQFATIIFLDPDNGLGSSGRHATLDEVAAMRQEGRTVVLIKFPGRQNHNKQIALHHNLLQAQTGAASTVTLRTCVSVAVVNKNGFRQSVPRVRWFTLVDADDVLVERTRQFVRRLNEIEKCKADVV